MVTREIAQFMNPTPSFVATYLLHGTNGHLYLKSDIFAKTAIWPRKCVKMVFSHIGGKIVPHGIKD